MLNVSASSCKCRHDQIYIYFLNMIKNIEEQKEVKQNIEKINSSIKRS